MDRERWLQIERIYSSAVELKQGDREAFLEKACAGDDELRREVGRLLARQAQAEDFIEAPAVAVAASAMANESLDKTHPDLVGRALLHYRITEKIGEGGMGEVYKAHDSRLNRDVAIKVLPNIYAGDPERKARFEREARLLATLIHPNIAAIHGLEEADEKPCLILELVEGLTLAERLKKGRIPLDETLDICRQITEGLEAAHEKGIIHRDLKPSNIKLTAEGGVKILDFGLAKAFREQPAPFDLAQSPAVTETMSASGVILGTAAYMSPEQARGKPVNRRTDVWAFGCILFECLTGNCPFQGATVSETIAALLKEEPDWESIPSETPARIRLLLRRCLQKDPQLRLHDIADAGIEIRESDSGPSETVIVSRRLPLQWLAVLIAIALLGGVLIGPTVTKYLRPAPSPPVVRSVVKVEPGYWIEGLQAGLPRPLRTPVVLSSDGRFIVYSAIVENPGPQVKSLLYLRRTDQVEAKPIPGTEGAVGPFLSPDDKWVGFWEANGTLMKVPVEGGIPTALCEVPTHHGVSWGPDGNIVFASAVDGGLSIISPSGGSPEALTIPDKSKGEYSHRLPHYLPSGKGVLFTVAKSWTDMQPDVAVLELPMRKWRVLLHDATDARYVETGHLVFLRQGTLMGVPFDPDRLRIRGQAVPVISDVMQALNITPIGNNTGCGWFSASRSGSLIYARGGIYPDRQHSLVWVDHSGAQQPAAAFKAAFFAPRISLMVDRSRTSP